MPRKIPFYIVASFTDTPFQGNPAGVFFDDDASLTDTEMQKMAGEVSLESAFVRPGKEDGEFRLRYFTGVCEVPFCGHDTVATAVVLAQTRRINGRDSVVFETTVNRIRTTISQQEDGRFSVTLFQGFPYLLRPFRGKATAHQIAKILGCSDAEIGIPGLPIQRASTGTPWLYVPVSSRAAVDRTPTDFAAIAALSRKWETFGLYVFTLEQDSQNHPQVWSRCYAPIAGLNEDPVTGSASGALGGYLAVYGVLSDKTPSLTAYQGFAGGRGGTAQITFKPGIGISVTGTATVVAEGAFTLPD